MDTDLDFLIGEDAAGPTKTEMDLFLKKFKKLTKADLEAALRVSTEDFISVLHQMVPCVGCRQRAEAAFRQSQKDDYDEFYPLCMDEKGMSLIKNKQTPKFLCTVFHRPSLNVQNLINTLSKCKSGRRCTLHSFESESQRIRSVVNWLDVLECMDEDAIAVDYKCLSEALEEYVKKHGFCTECKTKVLRAHSILIGELDPASARGFNAELYEGIDSCQEDQFLYLENEIVGSLIANAISEMSGRNIAGRHAKSMEIAQMEVLTCLGLCVFERLHYIQQRTRNEERTWKIVMYTAIQALRRSFESAVEKKLGVSELDFLCQELNKEDIAKQQRKERKKANRKLKKERKSEEKQESLMGDVIADEVNETLEESTGSFTEPSCHEEPVESNASAKSRKKKKSAKGKNKFSESSKLPLSQVINGVLEKSEEMVKQKDDETTSQGPKSRTSSESTSVSQCDTTCSSLKGSEISCADDSCLSRPRIIQGPYRSLMEQLEDASLSDNEEDCNWVPPEISAIKTESWNQEREQFRKVLKFRFYEMLKKRKLTCLHREQQHTAPEKSVNDENSQKDSDATAVKKMSTPRSGKKGGLNRGTRGGGQKNRNYKGKNRR